MLSSVFPATRWSLLGRVAEGEAAPGDVLGVYADAIGRYLAVKLGDRGGLEDLVQEVLLYLLERPELLSRAKPGEGSRFRYLLMRLCYNAARNARRRLAGRERAVAEAVQAAAALPESGEDAAVMDAAWAASLVRQAWDRLRAQVRDGLVEADCLAVAEAALVEGRTLRDIAEDQGIGLATCQRRLAKARTLLRRAVRDRLVDCGELEPGADPRAVDALLGTDR